MWPEVRLIGRPKPMSIVDTDITYKAHGWYTLSKSLAVDHLFMSNTHYLGLLASFWPLHNLFLIPIPVISSGVIFTNMWMFCLFAYMSRKSVMRFATVWYQLVITSMTPWSAMDERAWRHHRAKEACTCARADAPQIWLVTASYLMGR